MVVAGVGGAVSALFVSAALAFPNGGFAGLTGGPAGGGLTCGICHTGGPGGGGVDLLGRPRRYIPGRVYMLTVRVTGPGQAGAGFQISVETPVGQSAGELILADPALTQYASGDPRYVTHTDLGHEAAELAFAVNPGWSDFPVLWRAPAADPGPIAFYIAGNAINDDHTTLGDDVYAARFDTRLNPCPPDLDGDGAVTGRDLSFILSAWGRPDADADLTGDGVVTTLDLATALQAWGPCPPAP
ncbi:MAG: hypothetical protein D6693_01530 [Planctomycetota bacterium]|nr:MAG: hypothetical protein D6693_01530 [Planctomycetota bacterium]